MEFWDFVLISIGLFLLGMAFLKLYWKPRKLRKQQRKGAFFESSLGNIFFTRRGKKRKPTVVLIHGLGASGYCWRYFIPLIEEKFDVINIDLWGFGRSQKDPDRDISLEDHGRILTELLDHLEIKKANLVGCSMGGTIGIWYSIQNPDRINKVVGLAPAAHHSLVPTYIKRITWISDWTPLVVSRTLIQTLLYSVYANKELITDDSIDEYYRPYLDSRAHKTFARHLDLLQDERVFNSLPSLSHPTLVLWGAKDTTVPQNVMQDIVRRLPQTFFHIHPEGGHHLMEEYPDWCADKIIPFLKS